MTVLFIQFETYTNLKLETFFQWEMNFLDVLEGVDSESVTISFCPK